MKPCRGLGKAPLRGPFRQRACKPDPVVNDHLSPGAGAPRGRRSGPAAYLDLAGQGRRSCLALHRAGFAWPPRHRDAGALLPHHFTFACTRLTCGRAIGRVFLWHFPAGFPGWALPTASPCGVRTFLEGFSLPPQSLGPPSDGSAAPAPRPISKGCGCPRPHNPSGNILRADADGSRHGSGRRHRPSDRPRAGGPRLPGPRHRPRRRRGGPGRGGDRQRDPLLGPRRARRGGLPGRRGRGREERTDRSTSGSTTPAS